MSFLAGLGSTGASLSDSSRYMGQSFTSPYATQGKAWSATDIRSLMNECKYLYLTNPIINAAITKMAVYPITELVIEDQNKKLRDFYKSFLVDDLYFFTHLIEAGIDYNVTGNLVASVMFPFVKFLCCRRCKTRTPAKHTKYEYYSGEFHHTCKKCGHHGESKVVDAHVASKSGIRIIRWNISDIVIDHDDFGDTIYQWRMPARLKHSILSGKKHVINSVPQEFIDAVREGKPIILNKDRIYHMKRPTVSSEVFGKSVGAPMLLPVREDIFYLHILRKAQETIASEHLVPLRVLFPQGTGGGDQPYSMLNLSKWKDQIQEELMRFRSDRNYIPVLPVPIGNQTISGDGRALLLHQEIRVISEQIIAGMGVPIEFVMGGLSYSGSSVSMRMLENSMLNYRNEHIRYANWVVRQIAEYMGWPVVKVSLKDFKMADDLNRRQYLFNLWQAGLMCDQDLMEESSLDSVEQREKRKAEEPAKFGEQERALLAQTEAQNKANRSTQISQMDLQKEMQSRQLEDAAKQIPVPPQELDMQQYGSELGTQTAMPVETQQKDGINLLAYAQQMANRIMAMDPMMRATELSRIQSQAPELASEVRRQIKEMTAGSRQTARSLPEQRPPRREAESALI